MESMRDRALNTLTNGINAIKCPNGVSELEENALERVKERLKSELGDHIENIYPPHLVTYSIGGKS